MVSTKDGDEHKPLGRDVLVNTPIRDLPRQLHVADVWSLWFPPSGRPSFPSGSVESIRYKYAKKAFRKAVASGALGRVIRAEQAILKKPPEGGWAVPFRGFGRASGDGLDDPSRWEKRKDVVPAVIEISADQMAEWLKQNPGLLVPDGSRLSEWCGCPAKALQSENSEPKKRRRRQKPKLRAIVNALDDDKPSSLNDQNRDNEAALLALIREGILRSKWDRTTFARTIVVRCQRTTEHVSANTARDVFDDVMETK